MGLMVAARQAAGHSRRTHGAAPRARSHAWYDRKVHRGNRLPLRGKALAAAGLVSVLAHTVLLLALGRLPARLPATPVPLGAAWTQIIAGQLVDLEAMDVSPDIAVVSEAEALPEAWHSRRGDESIRQIETAPRVASGVEPLAPAPDTGEGVGQDRPEAWRRDRQTLRAQLTDGAERYRQARTRQGLRAASPQAERREPRVGPADAPETAQRALSLANDAPTAGEGETVATPDQNVALRERQGRERQSGRGPLEAAQGARRFDVEARGAASDVVDQRSGSDERHPGRIDLVAAGARGPHGADSHRGPADRPGAVPLPTEGKAASRQGAPLPVAVGPNVALSAREAQRARYEREIKRRAQSMLRFPRKLALELAQGETIVRFSVGGDGALQGPIAVTKSAGFPEFDAEAVEAVKRAAPFPRMPEPLVVHMRVAFENPVLR